MCSVLQKSCVGAVCLLPGIGAALGPKTWEKQILQSHCVADERVAGSMARAKLFLGQGHSQPGGSCWE